MVMVQLKKEQEEVEKFYEQIVEFQRENIEKSSYISELNEEFFKFRDKISQFEVVFKVGIVVVVVLNIDIEVNYLVNDKLVLDICILIFEIIVFIYIVNIFF